MTRPIRLLLATSDDACAGRGRLRPVTTRRTMKISNAGSLRVQVMMFMLERVLQDAAVRESRQNLGRRRRDAARLHKPA